LEQSRGVRGGEREPETRKKRRLWKREEGAIKIGVEGWGVWGRGEGAQVLGEKTGGSNAVKTKLKETEKGKEGGRGQGHGFDRRQTRMGDFEESETDQKKKGRGGIGQIKN